MDPEQGLKKRIMFRIRAIYLFRKLSTPLAVEGMLFVMLGGVISFSISIPHIIHNMSQLDYVTDELYYLCGATMHTTHVIQATLIISALLLALIARDLFRNIWGTRADTLGSGTQIA